MFKNYLQIALRNLFKDKRYSFINIMGLAIGLASCLLLLLFIRDETSFDKFWKDSDRLYLMTASFYVQGEEPEHIMTVQGPMKEALSNYFPNEIESTMRLYRQWPILTTEDKVFEEPLYLVDPEVAQIFSIPVLHGDLASTLNDARSIALSEDLAIKYFGTVDAVGKSLDIHNWGNTQSYRVGAVYQNPPHNTAIEALTAMIKIHEPDFVKYPWMFSEWSSANNTLIVKLKQGASIEPVRSQLTQFTKDVVALPEFWENTFSDASELMKFNFITLPEKYFARDEARVTVIYIFSSIAILILAIACINFTNLSISQSTRRAKEVSLRKVMGASKSQLVFQFVGESILLTGLAMLVALALVELALPSFNAFLNRELIFEYSLSNGLSMVGIAIVVGFLGGIYPAFVLSSVRPAVVLKANKSNETRGSLLLRNLLVIFQFGISTGLIVCTLIMLWQQDYATNLDLGYDKDHIVILHGVGREPVAFQQEMLHRQINQIPGVVSASYISYFPATSALDTVGVTLQEDDNQRHLLVSLRTIDEGYGPTFDSQVIAGRNLDKNINQDKFPNYQEITANPVDREVNVLINQTAVEQFGYGLVPEQAIGKRFYYTIGEVKVFATIVGVMPDTKYRSVKEEVQPELYMISEFAGFLAVRFTGEPNIALEKLRNFWVEQIPELPFVHTFVSDLIDKDFRDEQVRSQLLMSASLLAIVVSCLGLFGLASFTAERRIKEIGIRKVMGASVTDIVKLLTWQFSKPVLLACLLGSMGAASIMMSWLESFPYRIGSIWILVACAVACGAALLIAWLTVGGKAARVANAKPIQALRYE